jgi:hypothetical protein
MLIWNDSIILFCSIANSEMVVDSRRNIGTMPNFNLDQGLKVSPRPLQLYILAPWQFLARERCDLVIKALSFSDYVA